MTYLKIYKVVFAFVASLAFFMSCAKDTELQNDKKLVTFTIDYRLVDSNSMYRTKAVTNEQVLRAIKQCLPESIWLGFHKPGSSVYHGVQTGVETTLEAGTYSVSGRFTGYMVGDELAAFRSFTDKPTLSFNANIEIVEGKNSYIVDGTIDSFMIVIDYEETSHVYYYYDYPTPNQLKMLAFENIGYVFCQGDYSDIPVTIILSPNDWRTYKETKFEFSTNRDSTQYIFAEAGKFYKLHPKTIDSFQNVDWRIPSFEEGIVETTAGVSR